MKKRPGLRPGLWHYQSTYLVKEPYMNFNYKHLSFTLHPVVAILLLCPMLT